MHNKWFLHIDMDAFFASIEIASRPFLSNKPVAVGGSINKRTVISAASYKARKYGIHAGMPSFKAAHLCPELTIIRPDMKKYESVSKSIFEFILNVMGNIDIYSIDECFTYIVDTKENIEKKAYFIKESIKNNFKITCSIGIGKNKLIAKTASDENKPDGITFIENGKVYIRNKKVEDTPGIGRNLKKRLNSIGIYYIKDIEKYPLYSLKKYFKSYAYILKEISNGEDKSNILWNLHKRIKSIGNTQTLNNDITDKKQLYSVMSVIGEHIAFRMNKHNLEGNIITLILRYNDFHFFTKRKKIYSYIYNSKDIFIYAFNILNSIEFMKPIRLIGISISNLREKNIQMNFDYYNIKNFENTINQIKQLFGEQSIVKARGLNTTNTYFMHFGGIDRREM